MLNGTEVLTTAQMRAIEKVAIDSGYNTGLELMERAGAAVADAILADWLDFSGDVPSALVLCGPGNNGGDGYVIARRLQEAGVDVSVIAIGPQDRQGPDAQTCRAAYENAGGRYIAPDENDDLWPDQNLKVFEESFQVEAVAGADIVVDAILGTGAGRPLPAEWGGYLHAAFDLDCPIIAVDGLSGLDLRDGRLRLEPPALHFQASLTVAFHCLKVGHLLADGPLVSGQVMVADIGLFGAHRRAESETSEMRRLSIARATANPRFLKKAQGHKYDHGHVLILAGPPGSEGAAVLAARAALRTGAGLVTLGRTGAAMGSDLSPAALMQCRIEDEADLTRVLQDPRINAICMGPGLGIERASAFLPVVMKSVSPWPLGANRGGGRRLLLDADAITALAAMPQLLSDLRGAQIVLTPHLGEFRRLRPKADAKRQDRQAHGYSYSSLDMACDAAESLGVTVLLKGPDTVIAAPDGRAKIHSAFDVPWLATAGSGDVLAGLITGLLARGLPPLAAAATGAALHAAAARRFGPGLIADDLPEQIPGVFRDLGL